MHRLGAEQTTFAFRPDAEPALRVGPGEVVRFETSPAPVERLFAAGDDWPAALDIDRMNAVTGPVYVAGVDPGDAVAVEVLDVQPLDWCFSAFLPGFGLLGDSLAAPMLRRLPIRAGRVVVSERLSLPLRPKIGCLGLAPASGVTATLRPPAPWGGDFDAARRQATRLMFAYLTTERGLSPEDVYVAMSACCDLELGGPAGAVVLASVPWSALG